jgi:hypothetical protein
MCIVIDERELNFYDVGRTVVVRASTTSPDPGQFVGSGAGRHLYKETKMTKTYYRAQVRADLIASTKDSRYEEQSQLTYPR